MQPKSDKYIRNNTPDSENKTHQVKHDVPHKPVSISSPHSCFNRLVCSFLYTNIMEFFFLPSGITRNGGAMTSMSYVSRCACQRHLPAVMLTMTPMCGHAITHGTGLHTCESLHLLLHQVVVKHSVLQLLMSGLRFLVETAVSWVPLAFSSIRKNWSEKKYVWFFYIVRIIL